MTIQLPTTEEFMKLTPKQQQVIINWLKKRIEREDKNEKKPSQERPNQI